MAAGVTTSTQPNGKRAVVFINRLPTADPLPQRYTVTIPARQNELPAFPRLSPPMPQRQSLQPKPQPRPLPAALDADEVNPRTWRRIELLAWKADEETCDVVLLRPLWWIEQAGAKVGGLIRLAMPEMGVAGPAKVLSIGPCPRMQERKPGTQVVTGTFKHKAKMVLHLHLKGLDKPIGVTPNHPMYSLDRGDFIPAGNLRIGERLKTYTGVSAVVTLIDQVPGEQAVYNLEVHRDHVYYVSNLGVLVHNTYAVTQAIDNLRFSGARIIDPVKTATHHEIANAFAGTGLKPSSHFIMRLKHQRTEDLGLHTFGDLESIFKNGQRVKLADGKLISLQHGNFEIIINSGTGTLVTISPR